MNCKDTQEQLIDYIEGNLDETKKREFENHLNQCDSCKEEMKELRQIMSTLEIESNSIQVPDDFMSNVRIKVTKTQESRRKKIKHRAMTGIVATLFLTLSIGTAVATNSITTLVDWWKDVSNKQNEQMENYVQHGLGEHLNLAVESNGVKVTITSVVADDTQTLIYYEVEDQNKENNYMINYGDGLKVANQDADWDIANFAGDSPVNSYLSLYSESNHVFKGRLGVTPMIADEGIIQLELNKLEKVINTPATTEVTMNNLNVNTEFIEGEWNFSIPVKKHPSIVHDIHVETEIEGNPVIFDKLTIAPTKTVLSYRYRNENTDRRMEHVTIASLESKGKNVYAQLGSSGGGGSASGWNSGQATFETLYFEKPKEILVHIDRAAFSVKHPAQFAIDVSKGLPQTFEYLGNKISIDEIEIGERSKVVMTEELNDNRSYEMLDYRFYDTDGGGGSSASIDGIIIDKHGKKYKAIDYIFRLHELEQPRFFSTEHQIELHYGDGNNAEYIPGGIEIEGYTTTTFYDKVVEISLD